LRRSDVSIGGIVAAAPILDPRALPPEVHSQRLRVPALEVLISVNRTAPSVSRRAPRSRRSGAKVNFEYVRFLRTPRHGLAVANTRKYWCGRKPCSWTSTYPERSNSRFT